MPSRKAERRKRQMTNAATVAQNRLSGFRTTIKVPEGVALFRPQKEKSYTISLVAYELSKRATKFRLQDGKPGQWHYERLYAAHRGIGVNEELVVCNARTFGKDCPIDEYMHGLRNEPSRKKEWDALKSSTRGLYLLLDHDDEAKGLQLWDVAVWNFGRHLNLKINSAPRELKELYSNFHDFEGGCKLVVYGSEQAIGEGGKNVEFHVTEMIPRKGGLAEKWWDHGICLDDLVVEPKYDDVKKMFHGQDDDEDDGDEDDAPANRGSRHRRGEAPDGDEEGGSGSAYNDRVDEADDEDVDDDIEEEEEDDEEVDEPAKAAKAGKWKPEVGEETSYTYRGKRRTGTVKKINRAKDLALVDIGLDDLASVNLGDLEPPDGDADEDEAPARNGKAKASSRRRGDDDEDERPRSQRRRSRDDEDEDDDDGDESEDDEEDALEDEEDDEGEEDRTPRRKAGRR